jgi:hypothetical protein
MQGSNRFRILTKGGTRGSAANLKSLINAQFPSVLFMLTHGFVVFGLLLFRILLSCSFSSAPEIKENLLRRVVSEFREFWERGFLILQTAQVKRKFVHQYQFQALLFLLVCIVQGQPLT